jgi:micrococcal nuclease
MIARWAKVGVGVVAVVGVTTAVVLTVKPSYPAPVEAVVTSHLDGDTFTAMVNGLPREVRLIDVEAPDAQSPDATGQCLGSQASEFLNAMVPVGATLRLEFDEQQHDRYGQSLAAVYTPDGRMVNAEMAKAGLVRVDKDEQGRFSAELRDGLRDAAANRRGLHASPDDGGSSEGSRDNGSDGSSDSTG